MEQHERIQARRASFGVPLRNGRGHESLSSRVVRRTRNLVHYGENHASATSKRWYAFAFALCFLVSGCSFSRNAATTALPITFTAPPSLEQVVTAVNNNSNRIQQLHSNDVQLTIPGQIGRLSATLDYEQSPVPYETPGRFRLGGEALGSRQLDLGSNGDVYWMWVKQNRPPTVLWGKHAEFYRSAAQSVLPVPPSFIVDALGVVSIDPNTLIVDQLYASSSGVPGVLELRTRIPTPRGDLTRVLHVDEARAAILQQAVYDTNVTPPRLLAVADASDFVYDNQHGVTLPRRIKVQLPPAGLAFNFNVGSYTINQPVAEPDTLWSMPTFRGHQYLDLSNPNEMMGISLGMGGTPNPRASQADLPTPTRPEQLNSAERIWNRLLR